MTKAFIEAKLLKAADGVYTFVASDETLDRSGEVIPIDSWDLKNYKKNPVLLVDHEYKVENIVGKAANLKMVDGQMIFDAVFHEITQKSKEVKQMVDEQFLSTVSVGFMRRGPKKDGQADVNELFEISFVPVPANPSASRLKELAEKALEVEEKAAVEKWASEQGEVEEKEGRVLSGKNQKLIADALGVLKNAASALESLLEATQSNSADNGEQKGRDPKEVRTPVKGKAKAAPEAVMVQALRAINKASNHALSLKTKK